MRHILECVFYFILMYELRKQTKSIFFSISAYSISDAASIRLRIVFKCVIFLKKWKCVALDCSFYWWFKMLRLILECVFYFECINKQNGDFCPLCAGLVRMRRSLGNQYNSVVFHFANLRERKKRLFDERHDATFAFVTHTFFLFKGKWFWHWSCTGTTVFIGLESLNFCA